MYAVQFSFNFLYPKIEKVMELRIARREIVVLPDELLEYSRMVWHSVSDLGQGEPVALELKLKCRRFPSHD